MVIRLIRLYPLYLCGLAIALFSLTLSLLSHGGLTPFHLAFWKSLPFVVLMLPSPGFGVMGNAFPLNTPAWSLFYELCINLVFALTYRFWTCRNICFLLILTGIAIVLHPAALTGGWSQQNFLDGILRVCFFFPFGVLLFRIEAWIPRLPFLRAWHCLALFLALLYCNFGELTGLLILIAYPALVALAIKVEPAGLLASLAARVGAWSYAIYAVHFPLLGLVGAIETKLAIRFDPALESLAAIAALMVLAELLDRFYDIPLRKRLTALLARSAPAAA